MCMHTHAYIHTEIPEKYKVMGKFWSEKSDAFLEKRLGDMGSVRRFNVWRIRVPKKPQKTEWGVGNLWRDNSWEFF